MHCWIDFFFYRRSGAGGEDSIAAALIFFFLINFYFYFRFKARIPFALLNGKRKKYILNIRPARHSYVWIWMEIYIYIYLSIYIDLWRGARSCEKRRHGRRAGPMHASALTSHAVGPSPFLRWYRSIKVGREGRRK